MLVICLLIGCGKKVHRVKLDFYLENDKTVFGQPYRSMRVPQLLLCNHCSALVADDLIGRFRGQFSWSVFPSELPSFCLFV